MTWTDGASNGGTPVLDYKIIYDQSIGNYITLVEGHISNSYTTVLMLTKGRLYKFKVYSRNSAGFSLESEEIQILAASIPAQPPVPETVMSSNFLSLVIGWGIPADGSATITSYKVEILANDGVTYFED